MRSSFNPRPARRPAAPSATASAEWSASMFQSTAGPETGRSVFWPETLPDRREFQSTAGPETGRSRPIDGIAKSVPVVSIHGRPGDRPLRAGRRAREAREAFQSTAGPETGRSPPDAMPACHFCTFQSTAGPETGRSGWEYPSWRQRRKRFQSTAGPETGRSCEVSPRHSRSNCFNPRPARRPAAPTSARLVWQAQMVSIHGRPGDRPLRPA